METILTILRRIIATVMGKSLQALRPLVNPEPDKIDFETLRDLILEHGGDYKEGKPFLVGLRDSSNFGKFNDFFALMYREGFTKDGAPRLFTFGGTTDPGKKGSAWLCLGMYNKLWIRGERKSFKKFCKNGIVLRQNGSKCRIIRAAKGANIPAPDAYQKDGDFDIQFHPMGTTNKEKMSIGNWSEGCQGPMKISNYYEVLRTLENFDDRHTKPQRISYWLTSLKNKDVPLAIRTNQYNTRMVYDAK